LLGFDVASLNYGAPEKLKGVLDVLGIDNDVKEYLDAGYSFLNKHPAALAVLLGAAGPEATLPRFFTVLNVVPGPLTGTGFDAEAAADARSRIVSFFDRYLATARRLVCQGLEQRTLRATERLPLCRVVGVFCLDDVQQRGIDVRGRHDLAGPDAALPGEVSEFLRIVRVAFR
jgi:hypothetical protein